MIPEQSSTPLFDAVKQHVAAGVIPFHVPGHKHGEGLPEFREYLGETLLKMDLNGMADLDFAASPTGVIAQAERLLAKAFGSDAAFFLVNGTTSGVQAMILSTCNPGDHIILPRNVHKSVINGIILSGAIPVYIQPEIDAELGLVTGVTLENVRKTIQEHPHAKAVFMINPSYYGIVPDLKSIVRLAHGSEMAVLVDEAHGAHMSFHGEFPLTAMEVGADMSAVSMHKTGGSLTQSAVLLIRGSRVPAKLIRQVLNLTYTTSASYILLCSLDIARKQLATQGHELLGEALRLARWAREQINMIPGIYAIGRELIGAPGVYDFDELKLTLHLRKLGLTGYEAERVLRNRFKIQVELSDLDHILPYISIGDTEGSLQTLIDALQKIASEHGVEGKERRKTSILPPVPKMIVTPRDAFYSPKKSVPLDESVGEIAGEIIMAYPPGIPVICMGERITQEIIEYLKLLKREQCVLQGTMDPYVEQIRVLGAE